MTSSTTTTTRTTSTCTARTWPARPRRSADNALGVAGVAPQAQIMAVRVLDGDGLGSTTSIANGISFAAANGAGVINLSLGGPAGAGDQTMQAAIAQAEQSNAVVVAAAGNEANNNDVNPDTPCTLPNGEPHLRSGRDEDGRALRLLELRRHHRRPGCARRRRKRRSGRRHPEREAGVGATVQRGLPERHATAGRPRRHRARYWGLAGSGIDGNSGHGQPGRLVRERHGIGVPAHRAST